jgi:hypothetical protein
VHALLTQSASSFPFSEPQAPFVNRNVQAAVTWNSRWCRFLATRIIPPCSSMHSMTLESAQHALFISSPNGSRFGLSRDVRKARNGAAPPLPRCLIYDNFTPCVAIPLA